MEQITCQCGAVLTGWRIGPKGQVRAVGPRDPHVWAASADGAARGWDWTGPGSPRPAHDVLTGGPAAEIMVYGACQQDTKGAT